MIRTTLAKLLPLLKFGGSRSYWESRYRLGGNSGEGSYGINAAYKSHWINQFIRDHSISSAIEFGCGDGSQLASFELADYTGVDVSRTIIEHCRKIYSGDASKKFISLDEYQSETASLSMSIDVIFHLVEDSVYDTYLETLIEASEKYVLIYSTDIRMDETGIKHVRHRAVSKDITERFPALKRMRDFESNLGEPVRFDRGYPTVFLAYSK